MEIRGIGRETQGPSTSLRYGRDDWVWRGMLWEGLGGFVDCDQSQEEDGLLEVFGPDVEAVEFAAQRSIERDVVDYPDFGADGVHFG